MKPVEHEGYFSLLGCESVTKSYNYIGYVGLKSRFFGRYFDIPGIFCRMLSQLPFDLGLPPKKAFWNGEKQKNC